MALMLKNIRRIAIVLTITMFLAPSSYSPAAEPTSQKLDFERVREIRRMLREDARAAGWRISDRDAWQRLSRDPAFAAMPAAAEKLLKTPLPELPDDLYLEMSRTGN